METALTFDKNEKNERKRQMTNDIDNLIRTAILQTDALWMVVNTINDLNHGDAKGNEAIIRLLDAIHFTQQQLYVWKDNQKIG